MEANGAEVTKGTPLPIYAYVYLPVEETKSVEYVIDGNSYETKTEIPYNITIDTSTLTDGEHTLHVNINGTENNYSMDYVITVSGECIKMEKR